MDIQEKEPIAIGNYHLYPSQLLGKGATGTVYKGKITNYLGYHAVTMAPVAIKAIDLSTIRDDATRSLL